MGSLTNITDYYPTWVLTKNTHHITTKIGPQNYIFPTESPTLSGLWAKPKESPKFQKSHYDVANPKSHYDVANSKVPLRCGTIYKARCYTTILYKISKSFLQSLNSYLASIFTKPEFLFGIYFTKPEFLFGIYFRKAQILIWHYFIKPKILFWQLSLHSFIKPKY